MKCFILDLITAHDFTMPLLFQNLILLFARIWPESLTWPCSTDQTQSNYIEEDFDTAMKKNPILSIIIYIVKENIFKNNRLLENLDRESNIKFTEYSSYYVYVKLIFFLLKFDFKLNKILFL